MKHYLLYTVFFFLLLSSLKGQDALKVSLGLAGGMPLDKETQTYYSFSYAGEFNLKLISDDDYDDSKFDLTGFTIGIQLFNKKKGIVFPEKYRYTDMASYEYAESGIKYTYHRKFSIGVDVGLNAIAKYGKKGVYSDTLYTSWDASISPFINYKVGKIIFYNKIRFLLSNPMLSSINIGILFPLFTLREN